MSAAKRGLLIVLLLGVIAATYIPLIRILKGDQRLNVLVVSLCSFRLNSLVHYGQKGEPIAPNIDKFVSESSFVFDNMFNGVNWTSFYGYTWYTVTQDFLLSQGYNLFGTKREFGQFLRVPTRYSDAGASDANSILNDNDFEKDHAETTAEIRRRILAKDQPFFSIVHYKYLHYPLIDKFNPAAQWYKYLSESDRKLLSVYMSHPEKYFAKMPFLLMLTDDPKYAFAHPEVRKHVKNDVKGRREVTGLLTNKRFLLEWKASPGYERDLEILEKIYAANVNYLDKVIEPLLNLYGDRDLQQNTLVIFSPDHGETHMEHDALTHGFSLYDEALRVPMAVRFPGQNGEPVIIKDQVDFLAMAKVLHDVVEGKVTAANFRESLAAVKHDSFIARDCLNSKRALRYKNKYKYIVEVDSGERHLYDLEADPGESRDIAQAKPDVVGQMEEEYWRQYPEYSDTDVYKCAPWTPVTGS
jgi:arylsulfatase A-like enzyme